MNNGLLYSENNLMPEFNSSMIKRFQPKEEKFPATAHLTRYHYTSADALMKILSTKSDTANVRFTDVRYLNDKSEMLFFVKMLLVFLNAEKSQYPFCFEIVNALLLKKHKIDEYINLEVPEIEFTELVEPHQTRSFVFCTCKDHDSLNMWNYYVQNGEYQGYSIGIDLYKFLKSFDANKGDSLDPLLFFYGEVIYSKEKQIKEIRALCDALEKMRKKAQFDNSTYHDAMYELYMYIRSYGMFFKDESFLQEKEYRILIEVSESRLIENNNYKNKFNKEIKLDFYERKGILVPCLNVPFEKEAIKKITIAPIMERGIASSGIKEFLAVNNYKDISVDFSNIPIRY